MEWKNRDATSQSEDTGYDSRSVPISNDEYRAIYRAFSPPYFSWSPPSGPEFITAGSAYTISTTGENRFANAVSEAIELDRKVNYESGDRTIARPRLFGGAAFDPEHTGCAPWNDFPSLQFFLPRVQITRLGDQSFITVTEPTTNRTTPSETLVRVKEHIADDADNQDNNPNVIELTRSVTNAEWNTQVHGVMDRIADNEIKKVVLAQTLTASLDNGLDVPRIIENLKQTHPDCFQFLYSPSEENTLFGSSPEQLISRKGLTIGTGALAGSIERGESPVEDEDLANTLRSRVKDQQEHTLVTEEIIEDIFPYCSAVFRDDQRVMKLDSVQHLYTPITGLLSKPIHVLELVEAIHPSPAVGGIPSKKAATIIKNTENNVRGWYASPVGWFDFAGNGDFVVSIRSAVLDDSEAILYAGAGIVEDSDPALEWDEVQLKYQPVLDVLQS